MTIDVIVLAAGKGTRMRSTLPKVLHPLAGKPLLQHVLDTARHLTDGPVSVVIGHGSDEIRQAITGDNINWVNQEEQLGTGHAVLQAVGGLHQDIPSLVLYGDVPLIKPETLEKLLSLVDDDTLALLTVELDNPAGYGRIIRGADGTVEAIVEEKDATDTQKSLSEVNTGVMAFPPGFLRQYLPQLKNNNAQSEYYLTDLIAIARFRNIAVRALKTQSPFETEGVNSRAQLHNLERQYQRNLAQALQDAGTTIADIGRFDCRGHLECGEDCFIDVNTVFDGSVKLGRGVSIGPNCVICDAVLGDGVNIKANTLIEGPVTIAENAEVGPFARLRPGTVLAANSKIGNFVETKKSAIGAGSKVNHLSYIGDTEVGENANIGAGTITCNYDGVNKFRTTIGDYAFIGSNTSLVAPVKIGDRATVGAGSTITEDVASDQLSVARGRQRNIDNWKRPTKRER